MELYKLTIHETLERLKKKEVTYEDVVSSYVNRIDEVEGKVEAALKIMADEALERAKELGKEGAEPEGVRGIPYGLKDNISTLDIKTTSASKMLYNFVPPYDAAVVEKLNEAGAILLGKMNMDEFGMGSSTEKSSFKTTRNPWDLDRVPGGSSGGSAAGVAAGEIAYSLGSDAGGSIRQPASFSGVVGLKPSYGLVSRFGLIGFSSSLEQIGPITKDVKDSAIVLNTIAGQDPRDTMSVNLEKKDYTSYLSKDIKGLKIGIPKEYFQEGLKPEVEKAVGDAVKLYKEMGAEIVETSLPTTEQALSAYYIISSAEASTGLARYDGLRYGYQAEEYDGLKDLYIKSRSQGFGAEIKMRILLGTYVLSSGHYDDYYKKALQVRTLVKEDFDNVFETCDIILSPTSPTTAFPIGEKLHDPLMMYLSDIYTVPVNIAGIPAISLPCGFDSSGLPIGLQLIGNAFKEETILKAAYAYEQEAGHFMKKASL